MDDPILLKAKEALQAAAASGDTAKAEAIRTKTIEYLQRRRKTDEQPAPEAQPQAAPVERSYMGNFWEGAKGVVNATNQTLGSLGITSGQPVFKQDGPSAAEQFINRDGEGFNYDQLDNAIVEATPGMAAVRAGQATGAAIGAVGGPLGAAAGAAIGGTLSGLVQSYGPMAYERAKNNGREEPTWADLIAVAPAAAGSAILDNIGAGRLGTKMVGAGLAAATEHGAKKVATSIAKEGATEAGQSVIEQTGSSLGTEAGLDVSGKQALGAGIIGAGSGGVVEGRAVVSETVPVVADKVKAYAQLPGAKRELEQHPEEFDRKLRIAKAFNDEKAGISAENPTAKVDDVQVFRNLWQLRYKPKFQEAIESSFRAGDITKEQAEKLGTALRAAGTHTNDLAEADVQAIEEMDLAPVVKRSYIDAARDLNEIVRNAKYKNEAGPFEHLGRRLKSNGGHLGAVVAGSTLGAGTFLGSAGGAVTASAADAVADKLGRVIDTALGLKTPPIRKGLKGRQLLARAKGIDPENSLGMLQGAIDDAQSRRQNVVILSRDYLQKKAIKLDAAAKRAEAAEVRRQEREAKQTELRLQKQAEEANRKAYEAEQRQLSDEAAAWRKAGEKALRQLQQEQAKQAQLAAKAAKAEAEAAAKQAELEKYDAEKGMTAKRLGAPRLGGWMRSLMDEGTKRAGVQVMPHDVKEALIEFVRDGRLTDEQVTDLMNDHGAQIDPETEAYYELQDVAAFLAARRNGIELTEEAIRQAGAKAREAKAVEQELNRKKARDAVKALEAERRAAKKAERPPEVVEKAKSRARKAAATRKARKAANDKAQARPEATQGDTTTEGASSPGGAPTGRQSTVRIPQAYQATINRADRLEQRAVQAAPSPELARIANEVARLKSKKAKALALAKAISEHPQHAAWLVNYVGELAQTGGTTDEGGAVVSPEAIDRALHKVATQVDIRKDPIFDHGGQKPLLVDEKGRVYLLKDRSGGHTAAIAYMAEALGRSGDPNDGSDDVYRTFRDTKLALVTAYSPRPTEWSPADPAENSIGVAYHPDNKLTRAQFAVISSLAKTNGIDGERLSVGSWTDDLTTHEYAFGMAGLRKAVAE